MPNVRGAFVPTYEVFAEDCYHLDWFLGDLARRPFHAVDIGAHVGTFACQLGTRLPAVTVTWCPRRVSPSARCATNNSVPPYLFGGTGMNGGATMAIRIWQC